MVLLSTLKTLFKTYKPVIKFILTFLLVYVTLSIVYKLYLEYAKTGVYFPDYMTHITAKQSAKFINALGYESYTVPHDKEASVKLFVNNLYNARVIEGCNGVSVIILFSAFIIAFANTTKRTAMYILFGGFLIYAFNIIRVGLLSIGFYHFPQYSRILHDIFFPLVIYGFVFVLWMIWVKHIVFKLKK